ncbi:MAG: 16S rRNA (cytidine(1402)-2'-O)-methyltransferase [Pseudomonadota bacterium]|nr:16S rRNA (cytidine(1402)-2'-O)-methyltransferase [Pseudomonadota bacterium]
MFPIPDNRDHLVSTETSQIQPNDVPDRSKRPPSVIRSGLYVVSTPIGNMGDLTKRAEEILASATLIACEDTRVTGKLLAKKGITSRMLAYHDHSPPSVRHDLIRRLKDGEIVALVSDAGTPLVSDPGYKLVAAAVEAGLYVTAAPGPASPMAALVLSGLPSDRFLFVGYLPTKENARRATIREFATIRATLIFLESARRLGASLSTLADVLGERPVAVARELTKRYEEVTRGSLCELAVKYRNENPPKGEIVVVVGPAADMSLDLTDLDSLLAEALVHMSVRDAAATVASASGAPRRTVYRRALEIARELDSKDR